MAYSVYRNSDHTAAYVNELIADTTADIENLPTDYTPGSTCIVIEDSSIWILGNDKAWHKI